MLFLRGKAALTGFGGHVSCVGVGWEAFDRLKFNFGEILFNGMSDPLVSINDS